METIKAYGKLMRIRHYIKNLLVFAALGCSGLLFHMDKFMATLSGFAAFCAVSSVVYIINDIQDRERDRLHPTKRNRPVASGKISVKNAGILAAVMIIAAAFFNSLVFHVTSTLLLVLYLVLNLAYSVGLKDVPLVDIAILTSGFLIRVMYGALAAKVAISNWLYLTVGALAFFFSLGKRRNELKRISAGGG